MNPRNLSESRDRMQALFEDRQVAYLVRIHNAVRDILQDNCVVENTIADAILRHFADIDDEDDEKESVRVRMGSNPESYLVVDGEVSLIKEYRSHIVLTPNNGASYKLSEHACRLTDDLNSPDFLSDIKFLKKMTYQLFSKLKKKNMISQLHIESLEKRFNVVKVWMEDGVDFEVPRFQICDAEVDGFDWSVTQSEIDPLAAILDLAFAGLYALSMDHVKTVVNNGKSKWRIKQCGVRKCGRLFYYDHARKEYCRAACLKEGKKETSKKFKQEEKQEDYEGFTSDLARISIDKPLESRRICSTLNKLVGRCHFYNSRAIAQWLKVDAVRRMLKEKHGIVYSVGKNMRGTCNVYTFLKE